MNSICFDTETTGLHPNGSDPDEILTISIIGRDGSVLLDAADHIGYEWTGRAHGSLADARATLAVQRWLEQWLVAE